MCNSKNRFIVYNLHNKENIIVRHNLHDSYLFLSSKENRMMERVNFSKGFV